MRLVAALGGNALLRRGEPLDVGAQRANVARAVRALEPLAQRHELVVTHGNGPQVGWLALQSGLDAPLPLDVLDAETEGMIGAWIEQELRGRLPGREVAALLTLVEVDPEDPAFAAPTKPIGPVYAEAEARRRAAEAGWALAPDGAGWRRVVPSPEPGRFPASATIARLLAAGAVVIGAGGGGIPVRRTPEGALVGVEAVVDKDLSSARLAVELEADALLLLTDVDAVYADWGSARVRPLSSLGVAAARALDLPAGSMGPKVEAACRFAEARGRPASIGALEAAEALLAGTAGTRVRS